MTCSAFLAKFSSLKNSLSTFFPSNDEIEVSRSADLIFPWIPIL